MEVQDYDPRKDAAAASSIAEVTTGAAFFARVRKRFEERSQNTNMPGLERVVAAFGVDRFDALMATVSRYACDESWAVRLRKVRAGDVLSVTPRQCLWLLANSFFDNIAQQPNCGSLSWDNLFCTLEPVGAERLLCLFDYFSRAHEHLDERGPIEFERVQFKEWNWDNESVVVADHVVLHDKSMEEHSGGRGGAFVDFANKRLQIHRIIPSLTQEEVLFSVCSEMFLCLVCFEVLAEDEAVCVRGLWRHATYTGYLDTFRFKESISEMEEVLAIDALTNQHFVRSVIDLKKCFAAFSACRRPSISTSKWGCGVFLGTTSHKFIQQLMIAQLTGKKLFYTSYYNAIELEQYCEIVALIQQKKPTFGWMLSQMTSFRDISRNYHSMLCQALLNLNCVEIVGRPKGTK